MARQKTQSVIRFRHGLLLALLAIGCAPVPRISHPGWKHPVRTDPAIEAVETYFELDTERGLVLLRAYAPGIPEGGDAAAESARLAALIAGNKACQEIWNFETFQTVGEIGYVMTVKTGEALVLECYLKAGAPEFAATFEDLISHLARQDVIVAMGEKEIGVNYSGKPIPLTSHNAEGHFFVEGKDGGKKSAIFWKTPLPLYSGVIGGDAVRYPRRLDPTAFADTVKSAGFDSKVQTSR